MKKMKGSAWVCFALLVQTISCSEESSVPVPGPPSGIIEKNFIKLEEALNYPDASFVNLVNTIRGSVGMNGPGSKVVWSRKNDYQLGLFVSANHVYGINSWSSLQEEFVDLQSINNGIFLGSKLPTANGSVRLTNELNANFGLYHPAIPSNASNTTILPKDDFYLGIIDNQRVADNGFGIYPNFVQTTNPLHMYDPGNRTSAAQTWAGVNTNDMVIAVGYPQDHATYPNGVISTGKVYSTAEAESIIRSLKQQRDIEGAIPYNPDVEFLANIKAIAGMSGGGVFNARGQLLGVMVRAAELNGEPVLRVVRITYIKQRFSAFYNALQVHERNKVKPFVSGELP